MEVRTHRIVILDKAEYVVDDGFLSPAGERWAYRLRDGKCIKVKESFFPKAHGYMTSEEAYEFICTHVPPVVI